MPPDFKPQQLVVVEWSMITDGFPKHEFFWKEEDAETFCEQLRRAVELLRTCFVSPPVYYTVSVKG